MNSSDLFQETYSALLANKARSFLTILGIVIGIASVIAMVSIGQGAQGAIQTSIEGLGSNLLTIMPGIVQPGRGIVSAGRGTAQTVKNGSFISDQHNRSMARVAVLGPTVAGDLFGSDDPLGKTIRINKINFKVIGILKPKGGAGFFNPDDVAIVPLTTMQKILAGVDYLSTIAVTVSDKEKMPAVQERATELLLERHRVAEPDFSIISQADILGALTQVTQTFTIFLASIAGISLLVGGIGIMNMMLTTVTERTRESGLRKAIGAKNKDISLQFLAEATMLTFIGGGAGVIFGWL